MKAIKIGAFCESESTMNKGIWLRIGRQGTGDYSRFIIALRLPLLVFRTDFDDFRAVKRTAFYNPAVAIWFRYKKNAHILHLNRWGFGNEWQFVCDPLGGEQVEVIT